MINLNEQNGSDRILHFIQGLLLVDFPHDHLVGIEMGVAYGGGIESLGKLWGKYNGTVYGFDTFEGHPKQLATGMGSDEATCMDDHYSRYGTEALNYDVIRNELDRQGLSHVKLRKGLIDVDSCWNIPEIHYCLLDLDILTSMQTGYKAVRNRIVDGGYLCLHDVVGHNMLPELHEWYESIKGDWQVVFEGKPEYLAVLKRVG